MADCTLCLGNTNLQVKTKLFWWIHKTKFVSLNDCTRPVSVVSQTTNLFSCSLDWPFLQSIACLWNFCCTILEYCSAFTCWRDLNPQSQVSKSINILHLRWPWGIHFKNSNSLLGCCNSMSIYSFIPMSLA